MAHTDSPGPPTAPTGNRLMHRDDVLEHVDRIGAQAQHSVLVLCDIDRFRTVNETLGRSAADLLLAEVGTRLRESAHPDDVVGSLGGDEFLVVCTHGVVEAEAMADAVRAAIATPFASGTREQILRASVGLAVHDGRSSTVRNLAAASVALRVAKEQGGDCAAMFDDGLRDVAIRTLTRTAELRRAATQGQLRLHFQPIVDLSAGSFVGCEGLLRWEHPAQGTLLPARFLDVAESSGLLEELLGDLVGQAAAAAAELAMGQQSALPQVAVNLDARQLAAPQLVPSVQAALAEHGLSAGQLAVEITETSVLVDMDRALASLHRLRDLGVSVALDDFGTGYSSLLHLRRLPVSTVKIDRSFIAGLMRNRSDLSIVAGVIDLAVRLGLTTVAEGVETAEQAAVLRDLGCDAGQGFLWSPARPLSELPSAAASAVGAGQRVDEERDVRARILRMQAEGASPHTVAAALNATGLRTVRGRRWHPRTVAAVAAAVRYPGPGGMTRLGCRDR